MAVIPLHNGTSATEARKAGNVLTAIKLVHTVVWLFFVACILGVYAAAHAGAFGWALACAGAVLIEVLVLVANGMRCPLTPVAARFTEERRANFDIYLPEWLAKHNQEIFGTLYVGGLLYAGVLWSFSARPGL